MVEFEIKNYKQLNQGYIRGQFEIQFTSYKFTLKNCKLAESQDKQPYILWPAISYEKDGKKKFFSIIEFQKEEDEKLKQEILKRLSEHIKTV